MIAEDYALSREGVARMIEWAMENMPEARERMKSAPAAMMGAEPESILALLEHIRAEHGSIEAYVATLGVDDDAHRPAAGRTRRLTDEAGHYGGPP